MKTIKEIVAEEFVRFKKQQRLTCKDLSDILGLNGSSEIYQLKGVVFDNWSKKEIEDLQRKMGLSKECFYKYLGIDNNIAVHIEKNVSKNTNTNLNIRFYLYSALVNSL